MLEARNATVRLGERLLLSEVSLAIAPGETVAVLGENGAGKSTLMKFLAGDRLPPRAHVEGEARIAGRRLQDWSLGERAKLRAVLPQRPELAFAFTAREVVSFGRYPNQSAWFAEKDKDIVEAALAMTDSLHLADREVTTLSGGEQARVHLAAAFAQLWERESEHDRYLLLDEPTAALDLAHQHQVLASARAFADERRMGVVAILHDLNLAATYADRIVILRRGVVLAQGAPRDMLSPQTIADGFGVDARVLPHPLSQGILVATAARA